MLEQAKQEAASIVDKARSEAGLLLEDARRQIASDRKNADDAIRQAARDVVVSMKADLLKN